MCHVLSLPPILGKFLSPAGSQFCLYTENSDHPYNRAIELGGGCGAGMMVRALLYGMDKVPGIELGIQ